MKPNETETYRLAQSSPGPLRVLWVGAGSDLMKGVSRDLFAPGNVVVALDLLRPDAADLSAATAAAAERELTGRVALRGARVRCVARVTARVGSAL